MAEEQEPTFEEQLAELEAVVAELDGDDVPLEQAIAAYEKGVKLSASLNKVLDAAQRKIEILTQDADGEVSPQPFEE